MRPLLLLSLVACAPDVVGSWEGTCHVDAFDYVADFGLGFDIQSDEGGTLSGEGFLEDENGYVLDADLEGERRGRKVEMALVLPVIENNQLTARAEVEVESEDLMVGDCIIGANGYSVRESFELERQ